MDKPISLRIQEFQRNISNIIGESGLPIFMIKYILKDLQNEIDNLANDFAVKEIEEYYQAQQAEESKESSEESVVDKLPNDFAMKDNEQN